MDSMFMGHTIKAFFIYQRPFWRQNGLMGYSLSTRRPETHPIDWTLDNCTEGKGSAPQFPYSLMVFMAGEAARLWAERPVAERRQAALAQLVEIFGPEAQTALIPGGDDYVDFDFKKDPFSLGGPTALMPPGLMTGAGRVLREPDGFIHWAGTEHSTDWCGYMDGAIKSGVRAAGDVLRAVAEASALASSPPSAAAP
jgi:monoamine oxidase